MGVKLLQIVASGITEESSGYAISSIFSYSILF